MLRVKKPKIQTAIMVCRHVLPVTLTWDSGEGESHVFHVDMEELSRGTPQGLFARRDQTSPYIGEHLCAADKYNNSGSAG